MSATHSRSGPAGRKLRGTRSGGSAAAPAAGVVVRRNRLGQRPARPALRIRRATRGRPATPDDVAGLVAFLASPDAEYMTAQSIAIDGGITSH